MSDDQIFELDIDLLQSNPLQPRGTIIPESLIELVDSIREHGVLEPLVIAKTPAGYQIIAGERRWRASKIAGLSKVPVIIRETTPQGMLEMAIVENVQRVDLNPLDRAQAFKRLMDEFAITNAEISQRIGKSPAYISNTIRLLNLPDALKDGMLSGTISEGHARALAALEEPELIIEAYRIVLRNSLSVRGTEDLTRKMKGRAGIGPKPQAPKTTTRLHNEELEGIREDLTDVLSPFAKKVKIKLVQSRIQLKLEININGDLDQTTALARKIHQAFKEEKNVSPASI